MKKPKTPKPKKPSKVKSKVMLTREKLEKLLLELAEVSAIEGQSISPAHYEAIKAKLDEIFGVETETLASPTLPKG